MLITKALFVYSYLGKSFFSLFSFSLFSSIFFLSFLYSSLCAFQVSENGTECSERCALQTGTVLFTCTDASFVKKNCNQENAKVNVFILCSKLNKTNTLQASSVFQIFHRCGQVLIIPFCYGT